MCGRFVQSENQHDLIPRFQIDISELDADVRLPNWNVAPTQRIPVVLSTDAGRVLQAPQWGFQPSWSKRPLINAQAETASQKATFKRSWRQGRCLVPARGFYEWRRAGGARQAMYFSAPETGVFALAGLWQATGEHGECTVLTMPPHAVVAPVHNRMPVMLQPGAEAAWLAGDDAIEDMILPAAAISVHAVDNRVGKVVENDEGLVSPLS